jgi:FtsP/CotA-like multicopper oxidase with cupredoxin domain
VAVVVKDGKVTPNGDNIRLKSGQRLQITLASDIAESIHVHGYEKILEVKPGGIGEVTFAADQKGVFEVETHETGLLVAKLVVS